MHNLKYLAIKVDDDNKINQRKSGAFSEPDAE